MDKIIVLNSDGKQDGLNYKCLTPQLEIAPHSQVCVLATKFEFPAGVESGDIYLINIPNLPIAAPNATPQKFGFLQTVGIATYNQQQLNDDTIEDASLFWQNAPERYVNLNNQETLNLTELHVYISDVKGQPQIAISNDTSVILKFRQDPNFVAQSNIQLQQNMMRDLLMEQRTTVVQAQNI